MRTIRPYFKSHLDALGYREHMDGFNVANIPATTLHRSYHVELSRFGGVSLNQYDQVIDSQVTVRLFLNGFRTPQLGIDSAVEESERIIKAILKHSDRLTQSSIKNVTLENVLIEKLDVSNDNSIITTLTFGIILELKID